MMKGRTSLALVMLGLVSWIGWSASAEPPDTPRSDAMTQEDAMIVSGDAAREDRPSIRDERPHSPEHTGTREPGLGENQEATHEGNVGTHQHGADTDRHGSGAHEHESATEHHHSGTSEDTAGGEGMGRHSKDVVGPTGEHNVDHSRMHETGTMEETAKETTSGNASAQDESTMGPTGGMAGDAAPRMHHDDGMMGSGTEDDHGGRMHGGR